jgi:hypothetical protein
MSNHARQLVERRVVSRSGGAPREARLDSVETCNLQAANQFGIERRHVSTVGSSPLSTELQTAPERLSNATKSMESVGLDALICGALRAADISHGQACAHIGNGKGGAYDQSQWTAARASGNLPFGRMLAGLPVDFWRHFIIGLAEGAELHVSHADIADIAVQRVAVAFEAVADAFRHMQRRSA